MSDIFSIIFAIASKFENVYLFNSSHDSSTIIWMGASHLKKGPGLACLYCVLYSQIWELFLAKCPQEMFCAITIYPTFLLPLLQTTLINTPPQSKRKKLNCVSSDGLPRKLYSKEESFRIKFFIFLLPKAGLVHLPVYK